MRRSLSTVTSRRPERTIPPSSPSWTSGTFPVSDARLVTFLENLQAGDQRGFLRPAGRILAPCRSRPAPRRRKKPCGSFRGSKAKNSASPIGIPSKMRFRCADGRIGGVRFDQRDCRIRHARARFASSRWERLCCEAQMTQPALADIDRHDVSQVFSCSKYRKSLVIAMP
jgi:hypothetical protein